MDSAISRAYNEDYQSPLQHLLTRKTPLHSQGVFNEYPVYLQHTLFHLSDDYFTKIREQTLDQRYLIFEQLKEMANK